jgi:hypothetical protein
MYRIRVIRWLFLVMISFSIVSCGSDSSNKVKNPSAANGGSGSGGNGGNANGGNANGGSSGGSGGGGSSNPGGAGSYARNHGLNHSQIVSGVEQRRFKAQTNPYSVYHFVLDLRDGYDTREFIGIEFNTYSNNRGSNVYLHSFNKNMSQLCDSKERQFLTYNHPVCESSNAKFSDIHQNLINMVKNAELVKFQNSNVPLKTLLGNNREVGYWFKNQGTYFLMSFDRPLIANPILVTTKNPARVNMDDIFNTAIRRFQGEFRPQTPNYPSY